MSKPKTLKEIEELIGKVDSADDIREVMRSWNIILENFEAIQSYQITLVNRVNDRVEGIRKENVLLNKTQRMLYDSVEKLRSDVDFILAGKVKLVKEGEIIVEEPKKEKRGID